MSLRKLAFQLLLGTCLATAGMFAACSGNVGGDGKGNSGSGADNSGASAGGDLFSTSSGDTEKLVLDPPKATILVDNGVSTPVTFTAKRNGLPVFPNIWYVDRADIAGIDGKGLVTATNKKGGLVTVFAEVDGATATATVEVDYKKVNDGGIAADDLQKLETASGNAPDITWAYPYDGTVWPRGLLGPELMWNGGSTDDTYLVHLKGSLLDVKIFTKAPPPGRIQLTLDDWVSVSETGNGLAVDVRVARLIPGQPTAQIVIDHKWTMAKGSLRGTVYYWANNLGRIVRIKPGQSAPDDFLAAAGVNGCSACHTVAANGLTLIIGGDVAVSNYDLLNDVSAFSIGNLRRWAMPAVSPDGKFVVENNASHLPGPPGGNDGLFESLTGQKVAGSGLDGIKLWMPAFGPKGTRLAYVDAGGAHDLRVYDFDLAKGTVSNDHPSATAAIADPNLSYILFPSVSPTISGGENSERTFIVYHRGNGSSHDTRSGPGELYLASADEGAMEVRLAQANGDGYPFAAGDRDRGFNYEPTFAPQASGGYMWVVFTGRRTYGNRLTGGKDGVKQLWVTAVDLNPEQGKDPSHPAFWVPGQDLGTLNMRGYWALDPCIQKGNTCMQDSDCCNGAPCTGGVCGGPESCAKLSEYCEEDADCCDPSAKCVDNQCELDGPV
ncbi:MAG: hypothetical protein EXR75_07980 [Myxococcales bacterium]|nr:hypothetical protein [Myxococcales bacterium]